MSDYLFAKPSFLSGAARVIDLWAELDDYNYSQDEVEADARAMFLDWRVTGEDIARAAAQVGADSEGQAVGEQAK